MKMPPGLVTGKVVLSNGSEVMVRVDSHTWSTLDKFALLTLSAKGHLVAQFINPQGIYYKGSMWRRPERIIKNENSY
jgi:hypothetical protein